MDTVSTILDSSTPHEILVDEVLRISGVSRGSLYHHFGDFSGLVHSTLLERFSANVSADGKAMWHIAETSKSKKEYWTRIRQLSADTQLPSRASARAERARLISLSTITPEFAKDLAATQDRLTQALTDAISHAQAKGWVRPEVSPHAISLFLQAYSLGRAIDDVSEHHVPNEDWVHLIDLILSVLEA